MEPISLFVQIFGVLFITFGGVSETDCASASPRISTEDAKVFEDMLQALIQWRGQRLPELPGLNAMGRDVDDATSKLPQCISNSCSVTSLPCWKKCGHLYDSKKEDQSSFTDCAAEQPNCEKARECTCDKCPERERELYDPDNELEC